MSSTTAPADLLVTGGGDRGWKRYSAKIKGGLHAIGHGLKWLASGAWGITKISGKKTGQAAKVTGRWSGVALLRTVAVTAWAASWLVKQTLALIATAAFIVGAGVALIAVAVIVPVLWVDAKWNKHVHSVPVYWLRPRKHVKGGFGAWKREREAQQEIRTEAMINRGVTRLADRFPDRFGGVPGGIPSIIDVQGGVPVAEEAEHAAESPAPEMQGLVARVVEKFTKGQAGMTFQMPPGLLPTKLVPGSPEYEEETQKFIASEVERVEQMDRAADEAKTKEYADQQLDYEGAPRYYDFTGELINTDSIPEIWSRYAYVGYLRDKNLEGQIRTMCEAAKSQEERAYFVGQIEMLQRWKRHGDQFAKDRLGASWTLVWHDHKNKGYASATMDALHAGFVRMGEEIEHVINLPEDETPTSPKQVKREYVPGDVVTVESEGPAMTVTEPESEPATTTQSRGAQKRATKAAAKKAAAARTQSPENPQGGE